MNFFSAFEKSADYGLTSQDLCDKHNSLPDIAARRRFRQQSLRDILEQTRAWIDSGRPDYVHIEDAL